MLRGKQTVDARAGRLLQRLARGGNYTGTLEVINALKEATSSADELYPPWDPLAPNPNFQDQFAYYEQRDGYLMKQMESVMTKYEDGMAE